jgi:hypothetical protein
MLRSTECAYRFKVGHHLGRFGFSSSLVNSSFAPCSVPRFLRRSATFSKQDSYDGHTPAVFWCFHPFWAYLVTFLV